MDKEYACLLHLLKCYLFNQQPELPSDIDWDKLFQLAQIHSVTGILGYLAMKYPVCQDSRIMATLRSSCINTIAVFTQRGVLAETLIQELKNAEIDHILMKGFVLRDYYPVPELRTFTDIDLVIRPEDRRKCHELMLSLDFQAKTAWEPVYSYFRGQEYYEVHTEIMEVDVSEKADYRGYFQTMWDHARPVDGHSYRFVPEFHFLYMLTHIAKHIHGSGAGIRMYLDIAAFIRQHGEDTDWDWIRKQLEVLHLSRFADVVLTAVEIWFGISGPIPFVRVDAAVINEFRNFTLEAGVFGHHNRDGALAVMKHEEHDDAASRFGLLLRKAFPKAETIQSRYTYLQEKPWLLPAAWVHRLIKTGGSFGKHAEEARQIVSADKKEVHRLKELMSNIGL